MRMNSEETLEKHTSVTVLYIHWYIVFTLHITILLTIEDGSSI